jgi:hypothetical protein
VRTRFVGLVFVLGMVAVGAAVAAVDRNWSTHANGATEVPARDTHAQGQAILKLSKDGTQLDYKLIASNIENVTQAHIHTAAAGVIGPIVVWLYPSTSPPAAPSGAGRTDGVLAQGTITEANLTGPFAGMPFSVLLSAINAGNAYVNIHTNDGMNGVDTGPGDFPGGEIRGDLP